MKLQLPKTLFKFLFFVSLIVGQIALGQSPVTHTFTATSGTIDSNISFTTEKNTASNAPVFNTGDNTLRLYWAGANVSPFNGCSITLVPASGVTITGVELYGVSGYTPTLRYSLGATTTTASDPTISLITSTTTYAITGLSITSNMKIRNANTSNTQGRFTGIKVTYTAVAPVVTPGTVTGTVGTALTPSYQIVASNSPTSYAIASGTLPAGLNFNTTTGVISGTPTTVTAPSITVTATNATGTSSAATINFTIAKGNQTITFAPLPNKQYGDANFNLSGTSSSGLAVTYTSSAPTVATVSGNTVTVVGVGTTNITASQAGNANYNAATTVIRSLTVDPKNITVSGLTGNNKTYDATTTATVTGTPTLSGVLLADIANVALAGTATYTFANANVGTAKAITVSGLSLTGSKAANYTLTQPTGVTADINPKTITATGVTAANKVYNGTTVATVSGGTLSGVVPADAANVSISTTGTFASANVGTGIAVTVALTGSAASNYMLTQPVVTADITIASQTITFNPLPGLNLGGATVNLNSYASASSGLALTYTSSNTDVVSVSGNTLTIVGVGTATITASQAGNANYTAAIDATQNVTVSLVPESIFANPITLSGQGPGNVNPFTAGQTFNTNITVSGIGRGAGISGATGNDRYNTDGYTSGSTTLVSDEYFEFTLTPNAGYKIDFNEFKFTIQRSGSGPSTFAVRSTLDSFTSDLGVYTNNATNVSSLATLALSGTEFDNITSPITFRIYGYNAGTGTGSINDFDFKGNVLCSKPTAYAVEGVKNACGTTAVITLSDSELGMSYQLQLNGVNTGTAQTGTGDLLSFGIQTVDGTYTIVASNTSCTATAIMVGNVVVLAGTTTTWSGSSWDNGAPVAGMTAIIAGNYSVATNIIACDLTVNANAVVTIPSGNTVTLTGALTVETGSSFTLSNNANLIQDGILNSNEGNITVKRTTANLMLQDYVLWSSPTSGTQTLLDFSPATLTNRFYTFNGAIPPAGQYAVVSPSTTTFSTANGYLIRMPSNHPTSPTSWEGSFTGVPNNGDISVASTSGNFTAVGNPYPSTIDADQFIIDNAIGNNDLNSGDGLYFWRKTNNVNQATNPTASYATYTTAGGVKSGGDTLEIVPNGVIQVGQGFIVKATSASLNFNNGQRVDNHGNQFLRNATVERNRIWLNLSNATGTINQMMVAYMTDATQGIDAAIDARYLNDSPTALNSLVNNEAFAIQGRSLPFEASDVVPMQFKAAIAGTYTIAIDHVDGLFSDSQDIFLRDTATGVEHDLRSSSYTFASEIGTFANRFEIVYTAALSTNNPTLDANSVVIYKNDNQSFVINTGNTTMSSVKVFDIRGRLLTSVNNINATQTIVTAGQSNEVLLVQVTSLEGATVTKKVVR